MRLLIWVMILSQWVMAGAYSPMVKPHDGNIIDIGNMKQSDMNKSVPMIWIAYPRSYRAISEAIHSTARIVDEAQCVTDDAGVTNCPLQSVTCPLQTRYSRGSATQDTGSYAYAAPCRDDEIRFASSCAHETACPPGYRYEQYVYTSDFLTSRCVKDDYIYGDLYYSLNYISNTDPQLYSMAIYDDLPGFYLIDGYYFDYFYNGPGKDIEATESVPNLTYEQVIAYLQSKGVAAPTTAGTFPGDYSGMFGDITFWGEWPMYKVSYTKVVPVYEEEYCEGSDYIGTVNINLYPESVSLRACIRRMRCLDGSYADSNGFCSVPYTYDIYSCPSDMNGPVIADNNCYGYDRFGEPVLTCIEPELSQNCYKTEYTCPIAGRACTVLRNGAVSTQYQSITPNRVIEVSGFYSNFYGVERTDALNVESLSGSLQGMTGEGHSLHLFDGVGNHAEFTVPSCWFNGTVRADKHITELRIENNQTIAAYGYSQGRIGSIESSCSLNGGVGFMGRKWGIDAVIADGNTLRFWNGTRQEKGIGDIAFEKVIAREDMRSGFVYDNDLYNRLRSEGFEQVVFNRGKSYAQKIESSRSYCYNLAAELGGYMAPPLSGDLVFGVASPSEQRDMQFSRNGGAYFDNRFFIYETYPSFCPDNYTIDLDLQLCHANDGSMDIALGCNGTDRLYGESNDCLHILPLSSDQYCVIMWDRDITLDQTERIKKEVVGSTISASCSAVNCVDGSCKTASCHNGYDGELVNPDSATQPVDGDCVASVCDGSLPYFPACAKEGGCPTYKPEIISDETGCKEIVCTEGGFNPNTKGCYKWGCPKNTSLVGGACVP